MKNLKLRIIPLLLLLPFGLHEEKRECVGLTHSPFGQNSCAARARCSVCSKPYLRGSTVIRPVASYH